VTSTTPGEYLVPDLVARFTARHPTVEARELVTDSAAVPTELLGRGWDVGFSGRRADDPRLTHEPVAQDEIVLAAAASHPLAGRSAVTVEALAGERLIQREEGSGTQRTFVEALAARGLRLPAYRSAVSLGSTHAVISAVEAGMGVGLVSLRALERHGATRARAVRVVGAPIVRSLYLVFETARKRAPHVEAFIEFVLEAGRGRLDDEA
jgi:DNA-binding transcriptional LysR family regulator